MTSRAFLLINAQNTPQCRDCRPVSELRQIPGIKKVEGVAGIYDFLVEIETTGTIAPILEVLMSKPWVRRMHVLQPSQMEKEGGLSNAVPPRAAVAREGNDHSLDMRTPAQSWLNSLL